MPRPTAITGDAAQVRAMLTWARKNGHDVTRISVGSCSVEVAAPAPAPVPLPRSDQPPQRDPRVALYAHMGGDVFREAVEAGDVDADLQPAIRSRST